MSEKRRQNIKKTALFKTVQDLHESCISTANETNHLQNEEMVQQRNLIQTNSVRRLFANSTNSSPDIKFMKARCSGTFTSVKMYENKTIGSSLQACELPDKKQIIGLPKAATVKQGTVSRAKQAVEYFTS